MDEKKVREAIKLMEHCIEIQEQCKRVTHANVDAINEDIAAYKVAIEALEKQLPKKVKIKAWCPSYCPSCGIEYDSWEAENYGLVGYCDYSARYDFTKYKYNESQVEADLHENHDIEFSEFVKEHEVIGNIFDNQELLEVE